MLEIKVDGISECQSPRQKFNKFWEGFEGKLEALIKPLKYVEVFDRVINEDQVFLFIKAPKNWCTLNYNFFLSCDSKVFVASFEDAVQILKEKPITKQKEFAYCKVRLEELKVPSLPKEFIYKEELDFHESKTMQFKCFPSKKPILSDNHDNRAQREKVMKQISAFANVGGGIILLGVNDDGTVHGQNMDLEGNSKEDLEQRLDSLVNKMKWSCTPKRKVHWDVDFFEVQGKECCFVIAIYVAGVRGGVFTNFPESFGIRPGDDGQEAIYQLEFWEWKQQMLAVGYNPENEGTGKTEGI